MDQTGAWGNLRRQLGRPNLAFLVICAVYLSFPSHHFNVDALHYNIRALLTAHGAATLLGDVSVPVHLAWHAAATGLLRLTGAQAPLQALYILEFGNIVVALASLYMFMRLVRGFAGDFMAVCATVMLAFSHACLRFFLSVEVYALNNLALIGLIWFAQRCCSGRVATLGIRQVVILAVISMAAITTHLSNMLLVPAMVLFFVVLDWRGAWRRSAVFLGATGVLAAVLVLWIAHGLSTSVPGAIDYILGYSSKTEKFVSAGPLENAWLFLREAPKAALGSYGLVLYAPLALFVVFFLRNLRALWKHDFIKFLLAYLAPTIVFYSQWDVANIEHKIAIMPALLLLVIYSIVALEKDRSAAVRVGAAVMAAVFVVVGALQGILPYRIFEDQELYRLSAAIRDVADDEAVVVVGLARASAGHPVVMSSATFFGQEIRLLDPAEAGFRDKLQQYREQGIPVLTHETGRFRMTTDKGME